VGYDDDRYGGALKVINSWSTSWGDGGFFWFPYSAVSDSRAFMGAYSVEDIANADVPVGPVDPSPPPAGDLPNLEILSWSADYDPRPGGVGSLRFEVVNSGTSAAAAGAYVNLMLSRDERIASDDVFVIYEPIPFDLVPGESAYRDYGNALEFGLPDTLKPGQYLMALWVDDLDTIVESNEGDNVSFGDPVQIESTLPDLAIYSWYADWHWGEGSLVYEVVNQGAAPARGGWDVNLMLSADSRLGNGDDVYLAYETTPFDLGPGESVFRDWRNPFIFDVYGVPPGGYLMALWVDNLDRVTESNERNNQSWGWQPVFFGRASQVLGASPQGDSDAHQSPVRTGLSYQYNGRRLPENAQVYRVEILTGANGARDLRVLGVESGPSHGAADLLPGKTNTAANPRLFPVERARAMPGGDSASL
jgi:hypothetical protein